MRFRLNSPDVIHETVDGEALIIHTPSGVYYSVTGTGEHVWNALLAGHTVEEISAAYEDTSHAVVAAVQDFARQLQDEGLLVPDHRADAREDVAHAAQPFSVPQLLRFTDMQELLLVDPIHEVDPDQGWPKRKDAS